LALFLGGTVALVAVNLASVAERNQVKVEQELLSQAVRRLTEVSAQLDADGPVVTGSQGQARPNPLLVVEQKLREEVDRRRFRVKDARSRYHRAARIGRSVLAPDGSRAGFIEWEAMRPHENGASACSTTTRLRAQRRPSGGAWGRRGLRQV
jgi:hypothetical protein